MDFTLEEFSITTEQPVREPDKTRQDCARELRVMQVSDHFQSILGCLLGEDWTSPRIVEMDATSDGHIFGRCNGEAEFKPFLGEVDDTIWNIHSVSPVAELDGDEVGYLVAKVAENKRRK
ncbi:MAG: hypothetical protein RL240_3900 [Planctomycetota bacterium]